MKKGVGKMVKKTGIFNFLVFTLVFSLLNIKIYSTEICTEDGVKRINECANYVLERSVQNINSEEQEKIRNYAYKICAAYSDLDDEKNCKLWYAHYVRLSAAVHISKATETGSLEEWRCALSDLSECVKHYSEIYHYKEARPFIPYAYGAAARVKYQMAKILNSSDAWSSAEQSFETAANFYRGFGYTAEKNKFKFLSLLSECRNTLEYSVVSKKMSSVSELKMIIFELVEKSKEIKLDKLTIKNYQLAYEIVSKICCGFQKSDINLIYEAYSLMRTFGVYVKILPGSDIESKEFFERFVALMNPFISRLSVCYRL